MPTPQRLPIVNSDDGVWGDIIRQYLMKEHYNDDTDNAANGGHQKITIRAGTASAGTAPLKFTSGTLLTTPEAGAVEFNTDTLYFTQTTGTTRKTIATYDPVGATGDIYYRNSSGYFTRLAIGGNGTFLSVASGIPAWTSSITGVTLDNTSTITLKDTNFTLQDDGDTSKQLKFQLSGLTTATTRTLTVPDANTTLVGTDATQTLTNKTINLSNNTLTTTLAQLNTAVSDADVEKQGALTPLPVSVTTAAATAAKVGTTSGGSYAPTTGDILAVTFSTANSANTPTLNIDGSGAKNVQIANQNATNATAIGTFWLLYYDGTNYQLVNPTRNTDSNNRSLPVTVITGTSQAAAVENVYVANNVALVTFTLPATASVGQHIQVIGLGAGGWRTQANTGQTIIFRSTTSVSAGYIASTNRYDCISLVCTVANTTWMVEDWAGVMNVDGTTQLDPLLIDEDSLSTDTDRFAPTQQSVKAYVDNRVASTASTVTVGTIELGHVSDTTLSRAAAGRLAVEGVNVPTISSTDTLTNKTLTTPTITTPVLNGTPTGTGVATAATASTLVLRDANGNVSANAFVHGFTTTATAAGTTTLTITSDSIQEFTGTTTQTVRLPTTSIIAGARYTVINSSTGAVTVQSSGANTVSVLPGGTSATFTALVATPTTAAHWESTYSNTGDASTNTATSVVNEVALFADTTGKILKRATGSGIATLTSGVLSTTATTGSGNVVLATSPTLTTPNLGTPSSLTLTNATGLPVSGITASTSTALGVGSVELGHASDTTLSRVSAGRLAVEGVNVPTISSTDTLTNKTISGSSNTLSNIALSSLTTTGTADSSTWLRGDGQWTAITAGDASTNTATSVDGEVALFNGTSGKSLRRATGSGIATLTSGVLSATATTGSGNVVLATSPTITTAVLNGAVSGTGVATAPTASTLALRDANSNLSTSLLILGFTSTATAAGTTTLTMLSNQLQIFTGTSTQTVVLPTTSVVAGTQFRVINNSTGAVTVQSSGLNTIVVLAANTSALFTALVATPTTAAHWEYQYWASNVASGKTLSVSNTLTLAGTDGTTMTFPGSSDTVVTLAATQTLTNKTITAPVLSGTITGTYTLGGTPTFPSTVVTTTGTQTLTNKTLTSPRINQVLDVNGNVGFAVAANASAVNYATISNGSTGNSPGFDAQGSDANIGFGFTPKGSGALLIWESAGQTTASLAAGGSATNVSLNLTTQGTGTVQANGVNVVTTTGSQALTNKDLTGAGNTFPTFNQNTTGSAATLTTARTIQTNLASTSSASFNGSANITPGVTGTLPVSNGGTGATTLTGLVKGNGTSAFTAAVAGTDYVTPTGTETLTNKTLTTPVLNGIPTGTGVSTATTANTLALRDANGNLSANALLPGFTSTATAAGTTTLTITSDQIQVFTGTSTQTVRLPTTGVVAGGQYRVINNSTGAVTVQSSGANTITVLAANTSGLFTSLQATPTSNTHWDGQYWGTAVASGKTLAVSNSLTLAGTDGTTMTFPGSSGNVVTEAAAQTLTNKTLSSPTFSGSYSFGGTPTWPTFNQNTTGSAATLTTARTIQTNLASTSSASFNGSANITPGVTGTLPVGNGGTGAATLTGLLKGNGTSAFTAATAGTDYVTPTGTETLTNKTLTNPTVNNYTEGVVSIGTVTTSSTLDLSNGTIQTATLTASTACTFTMPTATAGKSFVLLLKQAASTGNGTATFTGVKWNDSGTPAVTATAGKMDIFSFFADGTNWYGSYTQGYTP